MTKKIALVVDKPGWAFHRIAKEIKKYSKSNLSYEIYAIDKPKSWQSVYEVLARESDLVHFFWRPATKYLEVIGNSKITTSVYDHLDESIPDLWRPNNPSISSFWVSSKKLQDYYLKNGTAVKPKVLQDGVNFINTSRKQRIDKKTHVFGWVGNSKWGNKDHKGLETIIKPSIENLKSKGYSVELSLADASIKQLPHSEMRIYYSQIDTLLCASRSEGTPNPILEACANGIPWISTNVGIVQEIATSSQLEFIVDRNSMAFTAAMEKMLNSPQKANSIIDEQKLLSDSWSWECRASAINQFFEEIFEGQEI